jgi:serine/threonine protein kinase/uncharacterized protein with WD repeat
MRTCPTCHNAYSDDTEICPRDGARLTAVVGETEAHLASGLARHFRIVRRLGAGGMGTVFLAEQIAVGNRPVALKVLLRKLLDEPEFLLRFQNEAASTGRIDHPNVVTIYESGQADDGTPYIAMKYLEGETLRHALKARGALPLAECAEILRQIARGLNAAHNLGIIHRDLKPDNIFLTRGDEGEMVVKVVDFGIAKLRESATHTLTGTVLGTPAYMSYEQASGMKSDELDARSDIYSLGVVVYEMLTGRVPFHSDTPLGYLRKHLQDAPPPFRAVKPDLPALPQLESVVMKALTKERDKRYSSVLEFAREFARAAAPDSQRAARAEAPTATARVQAQAVGAPVPERSAPEKEGDSSPVTPVPEALTTTPTQTITSATAAAIVTPTPTPEGPRTPLVPASTRTAVTTAPETVPPRLGPERSHPSRRKWLVLAGSLILLIVAAVVSHRLWLAPSSALERTLTTSGEAVEPVTFSSDGKLLASVDGHRTVTLWDVGSWTIRQRWSSDAVNSVAFSPDGKLLASGNGDHTIKLWDVRTGTVQETLQGHTDRVESVAFSPDGTLLASGGFDWTIKLWNVVQGTVRQTLTGHTGPIFPVAFSPDGKLLASAGADNTVKLWDVAAGTLKQTHDTTRGPLAFSPDSQLLAIGSGYDVILWDVPSGTLTRRLAHASEIYSVAFSPDGKLLASGGWDPVIKLWDVGSWSLRQELRGANVVTSLAFSPDGKLLASGSLDYTMKLWRVPQ